MKELSIKEKACLYDEAIEKGKQILNTPYTAHWDIMKEIVEHLLPEIKESDGEKIRKALIEGFKVMKAGTYGECTFSNYNIPVTDIIAWLEKQGEQSIKWHKNTEGNKPQKNHSVLIKTTHGIAEGEWNGGNHWIQYRWSGSIKDSDVLFWIELSDIEKQGEQILAWSEDSDRIRKSILGCIQYMKANYCIPSRYTSKQYDTWIAWLEKQGKQKPQRIVSAEAKEARLKSNIDTLEVKEVEETEQRMKECPFRQDICNRYKGTQVKCDGRCSWVVDYPKLKELKAQKGE